MDLLNDSGTFPGFGNAGIIEDGNACIQQQLFRIDGKNGSMERAVCSPLFAPFAKASGRSTPRTIPMTRKTAIISGTTQETPLMAASCGSVSKHVK